MKKVLTLILVLVCTATLFTSAAMADNVYGVSVNNYFHEVALYLDKSGFVVAYDMGNEAAKVRNYVSNSYNGVHGFNCGLFYDEAQYDFVPGRIVTHEPDGTTGEEYIGRTEFYVKSVTLYQAGFNLLPAHTQRVLTGIGMGWPKYLLDQCLYFIGDTELVSERMQQYDTNIHVLVARYQVGDKDNEWFGVFVNTVTHEVTLCKGKAPEYIPAQPIGTTPAIPVAVPDEGQPIGETPAVPVAVPDEEQHIGETPAVPVATADDEEPISTSAVPVAVPDGEVAIPVAVPDEEQPIGGTLAVPVATVDGEVAIPVATADNEEPIH